MKLSDPLTPRQYRIYLEVVSQLRTQVAGGSPGQMRIEIALQLELSPKISSQAQFKGLVGDRHSL